jgi:hypothetical protein
MAPFDVGSDYLIFFSEFDILYLKVPVSFGEGTFNCFLTLFFLRCALSLTLSAFNLPMRPIVSVGFLILIVSASTET